MPVLLHTRTHPSPPPSLPISLSPNPHPLSYVTAHMCVGICGRAAAKCFLPWAAVRYRVMTKQERGFATRATVELRGSCDVAVANSGLLNLRRRKLQNRKKTANAKTESTCGATSRNVRKFGDLRLATWSRQGQKKKWTRCHSPRLVSNNIRVAAVELGGNNKIIASATRPLWTCIRMISIWDSSNSMSDCTRDMRNLYISESQSRWRFQIESRYLAWCCVTYGFTFFCRIFIVLQGQVLPSPVLVHLLWWLVSTRTLAQKVMGGNSEILRWITQSRQRGGTSE